jgi:hypothetical protein
MNRILLAICLSLAAGLTMAATTPASNDGPEQECPRVTAKAAIAALPAGTQRSTATTAATPVRARNGGGGATRMVSPRWHSLLPGMFR